MATQITTESRVVFSITQILGVLCAIAVIVFSAAGLLWWVFAKDVDKLETRVGNLQVSDTATQVKLVNEIGGLKTELANLSGTLKTELANFSAKVNDLNSTIAMKVTDLNTTIDKKVNELNTSIDRLNAQMVNYQNQLRSWDDPKRLDQIGAAIKKATSDSQGQGRQIIVVPFH
jgi:hypothetical protein